MSESIHDEDDMPTLEQVAKSCEYLIEPDGPMFFCCLKDQLGKVIHESLRFSYEQAETAICEAFKQLCLQDTAIISTAEMGQCPSCGAMKELSRTIFEEAGSNTEIDVCESCYEYAEPVQ